MKVKYKDHMGRDLRVAEAARVSFAEEVEQFGDDEVRLIKYLAKHNHWTPFAHPQVTMIMQAPVPIRTQC
jgi:thymidylate synthase (FAD)